LECGIAKSDAVGGVASLNISAEPPRQRLRRSCFSYGSHSVAALPLAIKMMFVLAFSLNAISLAMVAIALYRAPEGYEDELGFHFIRRSLPGCSGPGSLLGAGG